MSALVRTTLAGRALTATEQSAKQAMRHVLEQDRVRLLASQPFLATLAMRMDLKPVIDQRLSTAATDGQNLFFSVPFMTSLSDADRLFIMAHEVWHCAALHFLRQGKREAKRWNIAIDHEVNNLLVEQGLPLPDGAIHFHAWRKLNAESIYEMLPASNDNLPDRGPLADEHRPDLSSTETRLLDAALQEAPLDPDFAPMLDSRIWRDWPRRVHAAAQQIYRNPGSQPGWLERLLEVHGQPALPWQSILRRFIDRVRADRYQWAPPNRRYAAQGLYLPGRGGERLSLAVAIDTSGSTWDDMPQFLTELQGIMRAYGRFELRLLGCDSEVHFDHEYSDQQPLPRRLPVGGGGGTDFQPIFKHLKAEPPRALVILTDGFGPAPDRAPAWPVLWCLTSHGEAPCPWGQVLKLPPGKERLA